MDWTTFHAASQAHSVMAESRLWQAVIVSTIQEWIHGPLRLKRQAEEYLFSDNSDFPKVCESAGMDVNRLRTKLLRLRNRSQVMVPHFGR